MKKVLIVVCGFGLLASSAFAFDEAALKTEMHKVCAPLYADGGPCYNLAKGTRKCTRKNVAKAGPECAAFEKAHADFFDAGMNDDIIKK
jgi:hypothetical protein